jgi:hypothetical protein
LDLRQWRIVAEGGFEHEMIIAQRDTLGRSFEAEIDEDMRGRSLAATAQAAFDAGLARIIDVERARAAAAEDDQP